MSLPSLSLHSSGRWKNTKQAQTCTKSYLPNLLSLECPRAQSLDLFCPLLSPPLCFPCPVLSSALLHLYPLMAHICTSLASVSPLNSHLYPNVYSISPLGYTHTTLFRTELPIFLSPTPNLLPTKSPIPVHENTILALAQA